jgi:glycosyltransferase involved in cell wall biosynthesis
MKKNKVFDYIRMSQVILKWIKNKKYDLLHVQVPMPIGIIGLFIQKQLQIPFVVSEHYGIYNQVVEDNFTTRNFIFKYFTKRIFQKAQKIITVSDQLGKDIQREVLKKDFEIVPNVVDTSLFHFQEKKENEKFRFIHVSNMLEVKNIEGMLNSIKLLAEKRNDFEFYFIGAKPAVHVALAENLLLLNLPVFFIDEMPYQEVATEIKTADAGVLFSYSESQSCVVLEWLCAGLPVITSKVGGVPELISKENGILVESNNIQQLADAMNELIENKSNYNSIEISKKAIQKYSYESVGKKINEIYNALIH